LTATDDITFFQRENDDEQQQRNKLYKDSNKDERGRSITLGLRSLTAQNIGTSLLGLVFVSALIRLLPGSEYGIYSAIALTINISTAFATFGLQYASARYVSLFRESESSLRRLFAKKVLCLSIIFSSGVTLFVVAFSPLISLYFTKSTAWASDFALGGLWLFSSSIASIFQGIVQGLKKYSLLARILFVSRFAMVAFTIFALYENANVSIAILGWVLYGTIICSWALLAMRLEFRAAPILIVYKEKGEKSGEQNDLHYRTILRYSLPLGIAGILTVATQNADLVVVGGYLSPISLGIYNAVIQISTFLTFVLVIPLVTAILPEATSSLSNPSELSSGLRLAVKFIILGVLPASLFVAATSSQFLLVFSGQSRFLQGSLSLELVTIFYSLLAVQTVIYSVLQALGRTLHILFITMASTSVEIGGSLLLVPHVGLLGAAVGRVSAAFVGMIVSIYFARELFVSNRRKKEGEEGKQNNKFYYWKGIISAIVPFLVIIFLSNFFSHSIWTIVPYAVLAGILFLVCVRATKLLNNEDRVLLAHIFPRRLKKLLVYL
jgi:O-antigen/teichoic acid export membrane protein